MTESWVPIWSGIIDSSIWREPDHVFKVFLGMLAIKDSCHMIWMDSYKLANHLHMEHAVVLDALRVLTSPDTKRPGQPHEGRRVQAVEGGYFMLNGQEYLDKMKQAKKRLRDRKAQANRRARKAGKPEPYPKRGRPTPQEVQATKDWGAANHVGEVRAGNVPEGDGGDGF